MARCKYVGPDGVRCRFEAEPGSKRCYWHQKVKPVRPLFSERGPVNRDLQPAGFKPVLIFWSILSLVDLIQSISLIFTKGLRVDLMIYAFLDLLALGIYYSIYTGRLRFDSIRMLIIVSLFCGIAASLFRVLIFIGYLVSGQELSTVVVATTLPTDVMRLVVYSLLAILLFRSIK